MKRNYNIKIDFDDCDLRDVALSYALSASFIEHLCVIDASGPDASLFAGQKFDMVIFDDKHGSEEAVRALCREELRKNPYAIMIHVSTRPFKSNVLHLVGISEEFFLDYFQQLLGFCFLTHLVRNSMQDVHELTSRL
ncbi:MAG: hypothetical protein A2X49_03140 [Lentisphaerae bacterium GWF2_52_8]|nr:MAG: hypothetical protein A2X49_03140 [Lentisphaerae bacterium GWF2_52_8]